jgi:hypothetical protein
MVRVGNYTVHQYLYVMHHDKIRAHGLFNQYRTIQHPASLIRVYTVHHSVRETFLYIRNKIIFQRGSQLELYLKLSLLPNHNKLVKTAKYVPSDQDLNCSLFYSLGYFWPNCNQCRFRSDDTDVPADLDTRNNAYIYGRRVNFTDLAFIAWVNSVDPDQPAHLCHLIRIYTVCI